MEQDLVGLNIKELIWRVGGRVWHGVGGTGSCRELGEKGLVGSWRYRVWYRDI